MPMLACDNLPGPAIAVRYHSREVSSANDHQGGRGDRQEKLP
jgi:hypothetical protein